MTTQPPALAAQNLCAHCNKLATLKCGGCAEPVNSIAIQQTIWYCSSVCQKLSWSSHKAECKKVQARRSLYRTGETLQLLFYKYREQLFDRLIARAERRGEELYLYEGLYPVEKNALDMLHALPQDIFRNPNDRLAALVHLSCSDAMMYMSDIVEHMLKDTVVDLMEALIDPIGRLDRVVPVERFGVEDRDKYHHEVFKFTLKSDSLSYALDLTGAQYGYWQPIVPWDLYRSTRISFVHNAIVYHPLGYRKVSLQGWRDSYNLADGLTNINYASQQVLKESTSIWEAEHMQIAKLMNLPLAEFKAEQKSLVEAVAASLKQFILELKREERSKKANSRSGRR